MPIRPENKARYPQNWKSEIVPRIRARSGDRCECTGQCGRIHNRRQELAPGEPPPRCNRQNGMPIDEIEGPKIVLTVMHLDHQPENCADDNLLHGCQGCHLRYDAPRKQADMRARRHAQRASGDLFQCEEQS
jgi:hypothetical protein